MEENRIIKLDKPGPNNGDLVLIVDFTDKTVSLVEIAPQREAGKKVLVWEVQSYKTVAS